MSKTAHSFSSKHRTSDVLNDENVNVDFASLLLSPDVLSGLSQAGFERPSPIQLKAIPLGRCGLDLIVQAKSGTGKTCVFSVIILEGLDLQCASVQALVLTPTREIATQVQGVVQSIGSAMRGLCSHVFIGGTLFGPDRQKLKKCHVAVGTPGRVKQLIEYDVMPTDSIRLFVLDEADKLLEEKFQDQVNWIYNRLPVNKQMLALSATYPESLARGLTTYMRDPNFVRLHPRNIALKGIRQFYKVVPGHWLHHKAFEVKVQHLLQLLSTVSFSQCLVFSNLSSRAKNLSDVLCEHGWPSTCISSNQDQLQRNSAMSMLKAFQCRVLISTDLTARGIDAENVNLIVNLDVPSDSKTYMHRIGRAGRFGSRGVAVTLASEGDEETLLRNIRQQCHVKLQVLPEPVPADLVSATDISQDNQDDDSSSQLGCRDSAQDESFGEREAEVKSGEQSEGVKISHNTTVPYSAENSSIASQRTQGRPGAGHRSCQRSHAHQGRDKDSPESNKMLVRSMDKSCQVDTLSMPFNPGSPVDARIPSLAATWRPRGEEALWTWQRAAKDFEKFMSRCSGSFSEMVYPSSDMVEGDTDISRHPVKSSDLTGDIVLKCDSEDDNDTLRIVEEVGDVGSLMHAVHQLDIETPKHLPRSGADGEISLAEDPSGNHALTSAGDSYSSPRDGNGVDDVSEGDKASESGELNQSSEEASEEKLTHDEPSGVSAMPNEGGSRPPIPASQTALEKGESDQVLDENKALEACNSSKLGALGSDVKSEEQFKVGFSWRPTQDFFSSLLSGDTSGLLPTDGDGNESDGSSSEAGSTDSNTAGAKLKDSAIGLTDDGTREVKASTTGLWGPVPINPDEETRARKTKPEATEGGTSAEHFSKSQLPELLPPAVNGKSLLSNRLHHSTHNLGQARSAWQFSETSGTSSNAVPLINAEASNRQPSEETGRPGSDPTWQHYAEFLVNHEGACSEIDDSSGDESYESDADESNTSESPHQEVSKSFHTSDQPAVPEKQHPASQREFHSAHHYGIHSQSHLPSAGYQWVPDYSATAAGSSLGAYSHGNPTQFGVSSNYEALYSGQYAHWPYLYY